MKQRFFNIILIFAFVLAACGSAGPAAQSETLAITAGSPDPGAYPKYIGPDQWFRELDVNVPDSEGWHCIHKCDGRGDKISIRFENNSIFFKREVSTNRRVIGNPKTVEYIAASANEIAYAAEIQETKILGKSISSVRLEGANVITPDYGPSLEWYMGYYGTESRVQLAGKEIKKLYLKLYDNGIGVLDIQFDNVCIEISTGRLAISDLEFTYLRDKGGFNTFPFRTRPEYEQFLDEFISEEVETWLHSGALPDEPFDRPSSSSSMSTPIVESKAPDNPTDINQLKVNDNFRGNRIRLIEGQPSYRCIVRCGISYPTWVTVESGEIKFGKLVPTYDEALLQFEAWKIELDTVKGLPTDILEIRQIGDNFLVISPDQGLTWDAFWQRNAWDEQLARRLLDSMVKLLEDSRNAGLAYSSDIKLKNFAISDDFSVSFIDKETASLAAEGFFDFSIANDNTRYSETVRELLEDGLERTLLNFRANNGNHSIPTAIAAIQPACCSQVVDESLVRRQVLSSVDGNIYEISLTESQWQSVFNGSDEVFGLMQVQGLPIPAATKLGKGVKLIAGGLFAGLVVAGTVYAGYVVTDRALEAMNIRSTYQMGWFQPNTMRAEFPNATTEQLAWIQNNGMENTAIMFNYYDIRSMETLYNSFPTTGGCQQLRLNDPAIVEIPGVLTDNDVVLPVRRCANGAGEVAWINLVTDETITWSKQATSANQWTWMRTSPIECFEIEAAVQNNYGDSIVAPFRLCAVEAGSSVESTILNK